MGVHILGLESLKLLDMGKVEETMALNLRRAAMDCEDRPNDPTPRKVKLEVTLTPQTDERGNLDEVKGQFFVKADLPAYKTKVYSFSTRQVQGRGAVLVFNEDSPTNVNQSTLLPDPPDSEID